MKLPKGICDICGKKVAVENGVIRPHGRVRLYGVLMDGCSGSGKPPAEIVE